MEIKEIRRNNLRQLAKQYGSQRNLADEADLAYAQVNNIIGKNPVRNCGERLARKIEQTLNLPIGWLDIERSREISFTSAVSNIPLVKVTLLEQGFAFYEQQEQNFFSPQWLIEKKYNPEQIIAWEMLFDSMSPNIRMHDILAIDLSKQDIMSGHIYLFAMNEEIMLRRFTKQVASIKLTADSHEQGLYPPIEVPHNQISAIKIIGRVVALHRNFV